MGVGSICSCSTGRDEGSKGGRGARGAGEQGNKRGMLFIGESLIAITRREGHSPGNKDEKGHIGNDK